MAISFAVLRIVWIPPKKRHKQSRMKKATAYEKQTNACNKNDNKQQTTSLHKSNTSKAPRKATTTKNNAMAIEFPRDSADVREQGWLYKAARSHRGEATISATSANQAVMVVLWLSKPGASAAFTTK